ncbi:ribonuclease H [Senna tora]|uniref:Ribonuclease H n=1 Tax=Senna tora TaxID=362788 RepID=A0A834XD39_9FABA|nr:ribonuclease H [Senna tora]
MKMGWKIKNQADNLCCQVLKGKYGRGYDWRRSICAMNLDSILWKEIDRVWPEIQKRQRRCINDGRFTLFWSDIWGGRDSPLSGSSLVEIDEEASQLTVAEFCGPDGTWDIGRLSTLLPDGEVRWLLSEVPPSGGRGADRICWSGSTNGCFSVKDAYRGLTCSVNTGGGPWKRIWRIDVPERIRLFVWQVVHNKLLTRSYCSKWNGGSSSCHACQGVAEDCLHVLRDCRHAMALWRDLVKPSLLMDFLQGGLRDWWRNGDLHNCDHRRISAPAVVVKSFLAEITDVPDVLGSSDRTRRSEEILVSWEKPDSGWVKVNSDGAVKLAIGSAGCGAIIRDEHGAWVGGVIRALGRCSVLKAECWGALEGLRLAKDLNCRRVVLESDSKTLVDGVIHVDIPGAEFSSLFCEIRCLLRGFDEFRVQHRWRQANLCADFLADMGVRCSGVRDVLAGPPPELSNLMIADVAGTSMPRLVHL